MYLSLGNRMCKILKAEKCGDREKRVRPSAWLEERNA